MAILPDFICMRRIKIGPWSVIRVIFFRTHFLTKSCKSSIFSNVIVLRGKLFFVCVCACLYVFDSYTSCFCFDPSAEVFLFLFFCFCFFFSSNEQFDCIAVVYLLSSITILPHWRKATSEEMMNCEYWVNCIYRISSYCVKNHNLSNHLYYFLEFSSWINYQKINLLRVPQSFELTRTKSSIRCK